MRTETEYVWPIDIERGLFVQYTDCKAFRLQKNKAGGYILDAMEFGTLYNAKTKVDETKWRSKLPKYPATLQVALHYILDIEELEYFDGIKKFEDILEFQKAINIVHENILAFMNGEVDWGEGE